MSTPVIGFVGLGSMGGALVQALLRGGHQPLVFDLSSEARAAMVDQGALEAHSLEDLGRRANIVGICVASDDQVRSVVDAGLLEALSPGSVLALHSTLLPETVVEVAKKAEAHGIGVVEAPVTGGPAAAAEGRVTFLLAGEPEHVAAIEPLLAACGRTRIDAGALGRANLLKLCINLQTYVTHLAVAEAAGLARTLGVPIDALKTAMEANGQLGEITRSYFVLHELPDEILDDPGTLALRDPMIAIIKKDMRLMEEVASRAGHDLPGLRTASQNTVETYRMPDRRR